MASYLVPLRLSDILYIIVPLFNVIAVQTLEPRILIWTDYQAANHSSTIRYLEADDVFNMPLGAPQTLIADNSSKKVGLGYDVGMSLIFWADSMRHTVSKMDLTRDNDETAIYSEATSDITDLSVDWISRNLYWMDAGNRWIMISNYDGRYYRPIVNDVGNPNSIVVDPFKGYLYWSVLGDSVKIERCKLNGDGRETIVNGDQIDITKPSGLIIDYEKDKLYWVDRSQAGSPKIWSSNLDGLSARAIHANEHYESAVDLDIDTNDFIVCNYDQRRIRFVQRSSPARYSDVDTLDSHPTSVVLFDPARQKVTQSLCRQSNGGCAHLCINDLGDKICICSMGYMIGPDEYTCIDSMDQTNSSATDGPTLSPITKDVVEYKTVHYSDKHAGNGLSTVHIAIIVGISATVLFISIILFIVCMVYLRRKRAQRRPGYNRPLPDAPQNHIQSGDHGSHIYEDLYGNGVNNDVVTPKPEIVLGASPGAPPSAHYQPLTGVREQQNKDCEKDSDYINGEKEDTGDNGEDYEQMSPAQFPDVNKLLASQADNGKEKETQTPDPEDVDDTRRISMDDDSYQGNDDVNSVNDNDNEEHSSEDDDDSDIPVYLDHKDAQSTKSYEYLEPITEGTEAGLPLLASDDDGDDGSDDGEYKDGYVLPDNENDLSTNPPSDTDPMHNGEKCPHYIEMDNDEYV